jgi:hypothetical protein
MRENCYNFFMRYMKWYLHHLMVHKDEVKDVF